MLPIPIHVTQYLDQFSGRAWLPPILNRWFTNPNSEQIFLLTGGPGTGKSMIMGWLATAVSSESAPSTETPHQQLQQAISAAHFCLANDRSSYTPLAFADQVARQLLDRVVQFDEALVNVLEPHGVKVSVTQNIGHVEAGATVVGVEINKLNLAGMTDSDSFDISFVQSLKKLYENGYERPMLILVDALDEAWGAGDRGQELVIALSRIEGLPPQVKLLMSTRPDPRLLKHFRQARQFDLVTDVPPDSSDIFDFAQGWLKYRQKWGDTAVQKGAERIDEAANGIFLYAYMVLHETIPQLAGEQLPDDFPLPNGLSGLYADFLKREIGVDEDRWYDDLMPLLGAIAVAQGDGVDRPKLKEMLAKNPTRYLRICHQYLSGELNDGPFRLFHKSLNDYLLDDPDNLDYEIDAKEMHRLYAKAYQAGRDWGALDRYTVQYLPDHLGGAGKYDDLRGLLLDFNYLRVKLELTDIYDLLDDFAYLPETDRTAPARLVEQALNLSRTVLTDDKSQLAGHLVGRLRRFDAPEIKVLVAQADAWSGGAWIRPCQPTLSSPDGPLLMSIPLDREGSYELAINKDGTRLISGGRQGTKVWDLVTQEMLLGLRGAMKVAITADGNRVALTKTPPMEQPMRLADAQTIDLNLMEVVDLSSETTLLRTVDDHVRFDAMSDGEPLKTFLEIDTFALSADGERLISAATGYGGHFYVHQMGESDPIFMLERHALLSANGRYVVTQAGDEYNPYPLQVWDLAKDDDPLTINDEGYSDKMKLAYMTFSPDGSLLLLVVNPALYYNDADEERMGDEGRIICWDVENGTKRFDVSHTWTTVGYDGVITADNQLFVVQVGNEDELMALELADGRVRWQLSDPALWNMYSFALDESDRQLIAYSEYDEQICFIDVVHGRVLGQVRLPAGVPTQLWFVQNGTRVLTHHPELQRALVWDAAALLQLATDDADRYHPGHAGVILPDDDLYVSISYFEQIGLEVQRWQITNGEMGLVTARQFPTCKGFAYSANGRWLFTRKEENVAVWDLVNDQKVALLPPDSTEPPIDKYASDYDASEDEVEWNAVDPSWLDELPPLADGLSFVTKPMDEESIPAKNIRFGQDEDEYWIKYPFIAQEGLAINDGGDLMVRFDGSVTIDLMDQRWLFMVWNRQDGRAEGQRQMISREMVAAVVDAETTKHSELINFWLGSFSAPITFVDHRSIVFHVSHNEFGYLCRYDLIEQKVVWLAKTQQRDLRGIFPLKGTSLGLILDAGRRPSVWNLIEGVELGQLESDEQVDWQDAKCMADGKHVALYGAERIEIWNLIDKTKLCSFKFDQPMHAFAAGHGESPFIVMKDGRGQAHRFDCLL